MFIGHFGAALCAKRLAPGVSLGTLVLGAQFADLLWPSFVLLGLEHVEVRPGATAVTPLEFVSYPYSHGLGALLVWAAAVALLHRWRRHDTAAAIVVSGTVLSHWVLDAVTHQADMPLLFAEPRVGLALWNSVPGTLAAEGLLFGAGVTLYLRATTAVDRVGHFAFWALVAFLLLVYLGSVFGPAPPGVGAVVWSIQAIWLVVAWGYWIDRHRTVERAGLVDMRL